MEGAMVEKSDAKDVSEGTEAPLDDPLGLVIVTKDLILPSREWMIQEFWPAHGIGFIGGPPKAGKSWLALDLAIAVATEGRFLGHQVLKPGRVIYLLGEEFVPDALGRTDMILAGNGIDRDALRRTYALPVRCQI
jgi:RecA-family ATPase